MDQHIVLLDAEFYFAYHQFCLSDAGAPVPDELWTEADFEAGMSVREGLVAVHTDVQFGDARIRVVLGAHKPSGRAGEWDRVVEAELDVRSGWLHIAGPEDPLHPLRVAVPVGRYRVTIAQREVGEEAIEVGVWMEGVEA